MSTLPQEHDERLNLRPVVLGVCFFWGLFCGFLINVLRDHDAYPEQHIPAQVANGSGTQDRKLSRDLQVIKKEQENLQQAQKAKPPDRQEAPPPPDAALAQAKPVIEPLQARRPGLAPLQINPAWGLTGRTAEHPTMPLRVPKGPAAPEPAKRRRLEDLAPPELEPLQ